MAYSELIKNFNRIRNYMRDFYVFGFKSREEFTRKSSRSYDDERRRMESWLGPYMQFRQTPDGKNVFIVIDSHVARHNPLYAAWKTKSFTDGDITLHFILFDILYDPSQEFSLAQLLPRIDGYLSRFDEPRTFDESTVRKKLQEYVAEGIIVAEKRGRTVYYRRADSCASLPADALDFFSEVAPCGVVGSFLLDKEPPRESVISFKHHYITSAMDSEIILQLLEAIGEKRSIFIETARRRKEGLMKACIVPLLIMVSAQNGRQHLIAYWPKHGRIASFRTDSIVSVKPGEVCEEYDSHHAALSRMLPHMWGVSTQAENRSRMDHIEFSIIYAENEDYIPKRLMRERRCGKVEIISDHSCRFSADVYDAHELIPWIRTFICRITEFCCSDRDLEAQFKRDLKEMYKAYGIEEGPEE